MRQDSRMELCPGSRGAILAPGCEELITVFQPTHGAFRTLSGSQIVADSVWGAHQGPFTFSSPGCCACWLLVSHSCLLLRGGIFSK